MSSDEELREKLKSEILSASWSDLEPHFNRGALFLVAGELDLVDVGIKAATDDALAIGKWIEANQIVRPNALDIAKWSQNPNQSFKFLIVAPYVLTQIEATTH